MEGEDFHKNLLVLSKRDSRRKLIFKSALRRRADHEAQKLAGLPLDYLKIKIIV